MQKEIKEVKQEEVEEDDSDDDIGPMPMKKEEVETKEPEKKESYELADLPCAAMYEKSYTHPSHVLLTCVTPKTDFLYTASINGSVKIWKKFPTVFHTPPLLAVGHRVREALLRPQGIRDIAGVLVQRTVRGVRV